MERNEFQLQLVYFVKLLNGNRPSDFYEESLNFALNAVQTGQLDQLVGEPLLGLAKRESLEKPDGYALFRSAALPSITKRTQSAFDFEIDPITLQVTGVQVKLTWFDPEEKLEPFTLSYRVDYGEHSDGVPLADEEWKMVLTGEQKDGNLIYRLLFITDPDLGTTEECVQWKQLIKKPESRSLPVKFRPTLRTYD